MRPSSLSDLPPPPKGKSGWPWTVAPPLTQLDIKGKQLPSITIVTPSFNQGEYIEETIRSVLLQGYPCLDYVVVDALSTDKTGQILNKYKKWVRVISEQDRGQSDAINKGINSSNGEICAWINSDDFYMPGTFLRIANAFLDAPGTALVYGNCDLIDALSRHLITLTPPKFHLRHVLGENRIPQPSVFFRRAAWIAVGGINEKYHYAFDQELWIKMALHEFQFFREPGKPLAKFREWSNSKSQSSPKNFIAEALSILNETLSHPSCPPIFRDNRARVISRAWQCGALAYWRAGFMKEARDSIRRAYKNDPGSTLRPKMITLYLSTCLGKRANLLTKVLKRIACGGRPW